MTPEAQRIAIAEACGWRIGTKRFQLTTGWVTAKRWEHDTQTCGHGGGLFGFGYNHEPSIGALPDYLNDLNAMHEAEKVLTGPQWNEYSKWLDGLSRNGDGRLPWNEMNPSRVIDAYLIHAEAIRKAEAFLRTLNKWDDSK